jgi:hypothetical protein
MDKKQAVPATAAGATAGGGAWGLIQYRDTIGSVEWIGDLVPVMMVVTYLALIGIAYVIFDLRKRVKALEAR